MNYFILTLTFLSVNLDFFFILIFLLKKYQLSHVIIGYLLGNILLLVISFIIGKALSTFLPEWILGILGVLPIYMALHDNDGNVQNLTHRSEIMSVLITYLSVCIGCNLSIFLPVLIKENFLSFPLTLIYIAVLTVLIVLLIKRISNISFISRFMKNHGEGLMKLCYISVGLYVFFDSGLVAHLIALF